MADVYAEMSVQRNAYVAQYDLLDKNDPEAVQAFVSAMIAMLNY